MPSKQANANTGTSNHFTLVANAGKELNNVESLLKQNGYNTYTNPTDWFKLGQTISSSNVKKGDVLFFSTTGDKSTIEHVGVYLGSGNVLVKSGTSSKTYSLSSKVVQNAFVIAKRYN
ncbi:MAG TPA: NlpC/P60 family protein [Bacillota bacterium]|nr:NlpC/P60 family protein [Bacillota bacterium]